MEEQGLIPSDREESAARCHKCGSSLTTPEILLYGNRCLFCSDTKKDISMWQFLQHSRLDLLIYKQMLKWKNLEEKCPDCQSGWIHQVVEKARDGRGKDKVDTFICPSCNGKNMINLGRTKLLGHLGFVGVQYYEELSLKQKKILLKSLKESKLEEGGDLK